MSLLILRLPQHILIKFRCFLVHHLCPLRLRHLIPTPLPPLLLLLLLLLTLLTSSKSAE